MKKKKYNYGTSGVVRNYIESPDETLMKNKYNLASAYKESSNDPWTQGLDMFGGMAMQYGMSMFQQGGGMGQLGKDLKGGFGARKAMGGTAKGVNIEAEGGEIIETPQGEMQELHGAKHSQGGIDLQVPEGTKIFSEQLKGINGLSMADRKKKREKTKLKFEKLMKDNPSDMTLKETLNRVMKSNKKEEDQDMMQMEFADMLQGSMQKYATGGTVNSTYPPFDFSSIFGIPDLSKLTGSSDDLHNDLPLMDISTQNKTVGNDFTLKQGTDLNIFTEKNPTQKSLIGGEGSGPKSNKTSGGGFNLTGGDMLGIFGNIYSTFANSKNSEAAFAATPPEVNAFKDFGNDALDANSNTKSYVAGQRENALSDLETSKVGAIKRSRNSARGVNQSRAMEIATEMGANKSQRAIYDNYSKQMMNLFTQQAGLENQQDAQVMAGEDKKNVRNTQNIDNYYSNKATDIAGKGEGIQNLGSIFNKVQERTTKGNVLNQSFDYVKGDIMSGKISQKEGLQLIGDSVADQNSDFNKKQGWKDFGLTKTEWSKLSKTEQNELILKSLNI